MKEILLTSSVLILALLALRQLFRRTISRRMQYTLWALVLVRLLVPLNVGALAHNVLSAAEPVQTAVEKRLETPVLYMQDGTERHPAQLLSGEESQGDPQSPPSDAAQSAPADEYSIVTPTYRAVALSEALTYVWYAGMLIVGAWFLFTNLRALPARYARRARLTTSRAAVIQSTSCPRCPRRASSAFCAPPSISTTRRPPRPNCYASCSRTSRPTRGT